MRRKIIKDGNVKKKNKFKKGKKKQPTVNDSYGNLHISRKKQQNMTLRERMMEKLKSSRFRYINEEFYTMKSNDAMQYFKKEPQAFQAYHKGYEQQLQHWPLNPLDVIIASLKKQSNKSSVVADFGCGAARLAKAIPKLKIHSFDLVALDPCVTVCDIAHTPLPSESVDFVVCCLSLMGTNFADYIKEANRILKVGGILKVAEVESRFENVDHFLQEMTSFGFQITWSDLEHQLFYFFDLKKEKNIGKKSKKKLPELTLKPCLYKKR